MKKVCPNCLVPRTFPRGLCEHCGTPEEWLSAGEDLKGYAPFDGRILLHCADERMRWFPVAVFEIGAQGTMPKLRAHCQECQECDKASWGRAEVILKSSHNLGHLIVALRGGENR